MRRPLLFVCVLACCPNTNLPATSLTSSQITVAAVVPTSGSALTESGALDMQAAAAAASAPKLALPADSWKLHVRDQIMPFWMMPSAKGRTEKDPFPSYRCRDGAAYGEGGCDFADLKRINRQVRARDRHDGPFEWLTGPEDELLSRNYIRMHSRQTYAYGVAYHLTGDPKYLKLAHRGVEWMLANAVDKNHGGSYTYLKHGTPDPDYKLRTSQDQSYSLLGLAFYYYLTRDARLLKHLTKLKNEILNSYRSEDWEHGQLLRWMLRSQQEPKATCLSTIPAPDKGTTEQKELVALLDQVNAYMLLTAISVPEENRSDWMFDLRALGQAIRDRFYNDGLKSKDQANTGISPIVPPGMFAGCLTYKGPSLPRTIPACSVPDDPTPIDPENCDPSSHHTDFGHSIKSFWMLYLIGREVHDDTMVRFAADGADVLLKRAYLASNGSWARGYQLRPDAPFDSKTTQLDTNKEWWIYAELDQMAGTLALIDPVGHVPYLDQTYKYWLNNFVQKDFEVAQWVCDPMDPKTGCQNDLIPKANLWKNAFHSTEHGLVAYITSSGINHSPATLYFALVDEQPPRLNPYYYRAGKVRTTTAGTIEDRGVTYKKVRAEFWDIQ